MNLENSNDLLLFINKEKQYFNTTNNYKIYTYFCKCFLKTIIEIDEKINDSINKNYIIIGSNVMFNVFWILLMYTNNLTLSIFLSERSILLYTEFVVLSSDPKVNKDLSYVPNIIDAMNFAYKKTIGPIVLNNESKYKKKKNNIKNTSFLIKQILQSLYLNNSIKNIKQTYTLILNNLINRIYNINKFLENEVLYVIILKKIISIINSIDIEEIHKLYDFLDYLQCKTNKNIVNLKYDILNY